MGPQADLENSTAPSSKIKAVECGEERRYVVSTRLSIGTIS
jgi:hypothetical protein